MLQGMICTHSHGWCQAAFRSHTIWWICTMCRRILGGSGTDPLTRKSREQAASLRYGSAKRISNLSLPEMEQVRCSVLQGHLAHEKRPPP